MGKNNGVNSEVRNIKEIFKSNLVLPDYQRAYKWERKHVLQLLGDLKDHFEHKKGNYRIGSVILHKEKGKMNIVDGQQRLTTLALLLHCLNERCVEKFICNEDNYRHEISFRNIRHNYQTISDFLSLMSDNKKRDFCQNILERGEMVVIELREVDEAFQFFDSQNSRGKPLAPYDLLKAYHFRAEENPNSEIMMACIKNWEESIERNKNGAMDDEKLNYPALELIIGELLFKIKQWERQEKNDYFTKDNIDVFKGANIKSPYPYLAPVISFKQLSGTLKNYPFQIVHKIVNGQFFFEYVEHYTKQYKTLFNIFYSEEAECYEFIRLLKHYKKNKGYDGCTRQGDQYVYNLFICTLLFYFDKFGEQDFPEFTKLAFRWAYYLRVKHHSVRYESVTNHAVDKKSLLLKISQSTTTQEILRFQPPAMPKPEKGYYDRLSKSKILLDILGRNGE